MDLGQRGAINTSAQRRQCRRQAHPKYFDGALHYDDGLLWANGAYRAPCDDRPIAVVVGLA
jgi:hypothetical protein